MLATPPSGGYHPVDFFLNSSRFLRTLRNILQTIESNVAPGKRYRERPTVARCPPRHGTASLDRSGRLTPRPPPCPECETPATLARTPPLPHRSATHPPNAYTPVSHR